jgi:hypothetical protein
MKRFAMLTFALATVLLPAGCGGTAPKPSLSSTNARERLRAVHAAQNQWGAKPATPLTDQEAIVGRWNHPWTQSAYIRFDANGNFRQVGWLFTTEGTYRFLSKEVIEINIPGTFSGRTLVEMKYHLSGDALQLHQCGSWIPYTRAPS